ncbi:hypothetical protein GCM10020218_066540 [Dactylosporangium vinaceum]
MLDGLLFADRGTFTAFGAPVTEDALEDEQFNRGFRARVGFVFQNSDAQVFSPSVREEIAFGCLQLGLPRDEVAAGSTTSWRCSTSPTCPTGHRSSCPAGRRSASRSPRSSS